MGADGTGHITPAAGASDQVAGFVERFDRAWRGGRAGLREFEPLVAADIVLTQPLVPAARGIDDFRAQFDAIFDAVPDLRGEVLAWGASADGVLIELALRCTVGGHPVELVTCDRIVLRDGLMVERHARMDPLPLVRAALRSPRVALRLLRGPAIAGEANGRSGALTGLAVGRLALGALGRLAPGATVRSFGAADASAPELEYMTRIFGARAIALGSGYLLSGGDARMLWQRIALGVDVSDTIAGIGHLRRGDVPAASALALTALTGCYAAVGAARLVRDLADPR